MERQKDSGILCCEQLAVCRTGNICRHAVSEDRGDRIAEIISDAALFSGVHVHVDHHHAVLLQMVFYQSEKFSRTHLKGYGNILVSVDHDHVVFVFIHIQEGPAVIGFNRNLFGKRKVPVRKIRDLLVDLHAFHVRSRKIIQGLLGKGSRSHSKDQAAASFLLPCICHPCHHVGRQRIIVIHSRQAVVFHAYRLHADHHVGGKRGITLRVLHLQIVVDRFSLVGKILCPEGKALGSAG